MLTLRLRTLEKAGVIFWNHNPTIPPELTYRLTARGEELGKFLDELEIIARRWGLEDEMKAEAVDQ